jgi:hypothetical protein
MRVRLAYWGVVVVMLTATSWAAPVLAHAAPPSCQAPPGTSAIDQYCETIPGAGGDRGSRSSQRGQSLSQVVPASVVGQLRRGGPVGQALLDLPATVANTNTSAPAASAQGGGGAGTQRPPGGPRARAQGPPAPRARSDNPLDAIRSAASSGTSAGSGLASVLVALGVAMAGLAWVRYRRSPG